MKADHNIIYNIIQYTLKRNQKKNIPTDIVITIVKKQQNIKTQHKIRQNNIMMAQPRNTKKQSSSSSASSSSYDYSMKMIIIGDSGVGKSSLLYRYQQNKFIQNYIMTIGMNYIWKVQDIQGVKIKLQIWDTAGQQKYKTITQNYYRNSDGAIIGFAINSRDSFCSVRSWIGQLTDTVRENTQIMLVGTKSDLIDQRQVSYQQALQFAQQNQMEYMQCSAKSGQSVQEVFVKLATKMKKYFIDDKIKDNDDKGNKDKDKDKSQNGKGVISLIKTTSGNLHNKCCNGSN